MEARTDHYMKAGMLRSQFDTVEPPEGALRIDVRASPEDAIKQIRRLLGV